MAATRAAATIKATGTPTSFTDEACSLVSGKTYQIAATAKRAWYWFEPLTVKDGGTTVAASSIESVDLTVGKVTFVSSYTVTGAVTVSGKYLPLHTLGNCSSFSVTDGGTLRDVTAYGSQVRQRSHGPTATVATIGRIEVPHTVYDGGSRSLMSVLRAGEIVLFEFGLTADDLVRLFAVLEQDSAEAGVNDLVIENVQLAGVSKFAILAAEAVSYTLTQRPTIHYTFNVAKADGTTFENVANPGTYDTSSDTADDAVLVAGQVGNANRLDGAYPTQFVAGFRPASTVQSQTWAAWVRWRSTGDASKIYFWAAQDGGNKGILFNRDGTGATGTAARVTFRFLNTSTGDTTLRSANDVLLDMVWVHVAMRFNSSTNLVELWVNGASVASASGVYEVTPGSTGQLLFGLDGAGFNRPNFDVDEAIVIMGRVPTDAEMLALYTAGAAGTQVTYP